MNDDNLKFDFEANIAPLVAAIGQATKVLTSLENKLLKVSKAGTLTAANDDVERFTRRLKDVRQSVRDLESDLQRLPRDVPVKLGGAAAMAPGTVDHLKEALKALGAEGQVTTARLSGVNHTLQLATRRFGLVSATVHNAAKAAGVGTPPVQTFAAAVEAMGAKGEKAGAPMTKAAKTTKKVGEEAAKASPKVDKVAKSIDKASRRASKSVGPLNNIAMGFARMARYIKLAVFAGLGRFFGQSMKESIEYAENLNLFNVAMGDSIEKGKEFVSTIQEQYGLDPSNIMRYTGVFYQLASAIGVADDTAASMSLGLTKMSVDLSSLFNMPIDTVMQNIQSGMQGMTRAVRKYGIDIRVSTIQQEALLLGMEESVLTMSEANRQGLRYLTMLKQTSKATGDFAKTIESPANQLRIMQEQVSQLARAVGNLLLGAFARVMPYVNGLIMALRMVIQALAGLMGFKPLDFGGATDEAEDMAESFGDGAGGVGGALDAAAKKAKKLLAPFDELNVLSEEAAANSGGIGGIGDMGVMDAGLQEMIAKYEAQFEGIQMKANKVRDAILEFLGIEMEFDKDGNLVKFNFNMDQLLDNLERSTGINFRPLVSAFETFWGAVKPVIDKIGELVSWIWKNIMYPFAKWLIESGMPAALEALAGAFKVLEAVIDFITPTLLWLWESFLKPFAQWTGELVVIALEEIGDTFFWLADLVGKWSQKWDDFKKKSVEVVQQVQDAFRTMKEFFRAKVANPVITVINGMLKVFEGAVNKMISLLNTLSFTVPDWVPEIGGRTFGFNIKPIAIKPLQYLAEGGVVRSPTMAMIGEGKYDEAVIPLGNSPQMAELLSKFADVVGAGGGSEEINVTVNAVLDGEVIYTNQQKVQRNRGYDFGLGAFAR